MQLGLKYWLNVVLLFGSSGLQVRTTRWPSPPPIRSAPVVVEELKPAGAPLIKVTIPERRQPLRAVLTTACWVRLLTLGSSQSQFMLTICVRSVLDSP